MISEENTQLIDLVTKRLTGEATQKELGALEGMLIQPENKRLSEEYVKAWEATHMVKGITESEIKSEWNRLEAVIDTQSKDRPGFSFFKIAAVVSLLIMGSAFIYIQFFKTDIHEIYAVAAQQVSLPDGSVVTLNQESKLEYTEDFNGKKRELWLTGEGYFNVTSNPQKPFVIHTIAGDVMVVGTSFNVDVDSETGISSVVVTSGTVRLYNDEHVVTLEKGEMGIAKRSSKEIAKSSSADTNLLAWRTKSFVFTDTPFKDVIKSLSKVYGKKMLVDDEDLKQCPVTVSFDDQPLDDILLVLSGTLDLEIRTKGQDIIISGQGCQ